MMPLSDGYYWVIVFPEDGWVVLQYCEDVDLFYSYMGVHSFEPGELYKIGQQIPKP